MKLKGLLPYICLGSILLMIAVAIQGMTYTSTSTLA